MPDTLLNALIKLASIGVSGICIFAIFWAGRLISSMPKDAGPETHKTVRFYMVIALISGVAGYVNTRHSTEELAQAAMELESERDNARRLKAEVDSNAHSQVLVDDVLSKLQVVLDDQESGALVTESPMIESHVETLREASMQLTAEPDLDTTITAEDRISIEDVLDEWVVRVGEGKTREEAVALQASFRQQMEASGYSGTSSEDWKGPMVVPDPLILGRWLVVVDPSSGEASERLVRSRTSSIRSYAKRKGLTDLTAVIEDSAPIKYLKSDYESTWE